MEGTNMKVRRANMNWILIGLSQDQHRCMPVNSDQAETSCSWAWGKIAWVSGR
jgi:hypothetical protein